MAWGGLWRRWGTGTRRSTVMQELTKQANPEWIDRAWLQIGLIRKSAGQFAEAVEAFTTLERVAPRSPLRPEARLQRALALVRLERTAEAERLLRPLAAEGPAPKARGLPWSWRRSSSSATNLTGP